MQTKHGWQRLVIELQLQFIETSMNLNDVFVETG